MTDQKGIEQNNLRNNRIVKPNWLKVQTPSGDTFVGIKKSLRELKLHTVCEEARCPNISECWSSQTATLMILGDVCTRGCRFCSVKTGNPSGFIDKFEPQNVAHTVFKMGLKYVVLTMVDRDDLADGGSQHVAAVVEEVQKQNPKTVVEVLAGDFQGNVHSIEKVLCAGKGLDVFAHNMETVERLTPRVRDARANYKQSLEVLKMAKTIRPSLFTKSSLMLGLGEKGEEVISVLNDLRSVGVDIVTFGQYLQPSKKHLTVKEYVTPDAFEKWKQEAYQLGFLSVASGPLVRSSYKASDLFPGHL